MRSLLVLAWVLVFPVTFFGAHWQARNVQEQYVVAEENQADTIKRMLTDAMWRDSMEVMRDSLAKLHRRHNWEVLNGRELWR